MAQDEEEVYRYLVVDSGPIIRLTGTTSLWKKAQQFYTVPAVLQEIRDAKARQHLESLPFDLVAREASPEGIQAVVDFARQTGDYQSLSAVDLQVLGLLYDLEREACGGDISHVRKTPKRTVGVGRIKVLGDEQNQVRTDPSTGATDSDSVVDDGENLDEEDVDVPVSRKLSEEGIYKADEAERNVSDSPEPPVPKTWAMLVNPSEASTNLPEIPRSEEPGIAEQAMKSSFGKMNLTEGSVADDDCGQFSDAEEEKVFVAEDTKKDESDCDYNTDKEISDEECDVYILDSDELKDDKFSCHAQRDLEGDLKSDFPSLAASRLVPYEGSNDEMDETKQEADEERKQKSLQPISNTGKLYNSFRNYKELMKPREVRVKKGTPVKKDVGMKETEASQKEKDEDTNKNESRIIGGMTLAGQDIAVEDDGEGWITSVKDIRAMKAAGALDPKRNPKNLECNANLQEPLGPPACQRAACSTTDFAMQNVILQMNLELLSIDGMKVRKLKSWVTRCGACFKVYTSSENVGPSGTKRLFCERCGSDMMQRIAASIDGKTGRLRLHLSKKYKHNLRGSKFSLPKPGTGNRFQGDLLLREDQLFMGAWNQKLKMSSGGKAKSAAQSMFGKDIATNVGCHTNAMNSTDVIQVGFGRRNPNAVKGRERRGKKKKSADKACGLRRY